jgi:hypothetical protein
MKHTLISLAILVLISACTPPAQEADLRQGESDFVQERNGLLHGEVMALAYSGFREGQHPDRGIGARNPTDEQILEDLHILVDHGYGLIRLYDTGENSRTTLELIEKHDLPIKVLLGIWLRAEVSNHEGCPWLIKRGIELARRFEEIVVAISVGNEALVDWNDHMVPLEQVITYVRQVKKAATQPVTVAEHLPGLGAEVDRRGSVIHDRKHRRRTRGVAGYANRYSRSRVGYDCRRVSRSGQ